MSENHNSPSVPAIEPVDREAFTEALEENGPVLISLLQQGDITMAGDLISELQGRRDQVLYSEVGRLTRALHNSIRDFHLDIGLDGHQAVQDELSEIADARSRLDYVINLTEEAATTTMDRVDESLPLAQRLADEARHLREAWNEQTVDGDKVVHGKVADLLQMTVTDSAVLQEKLNEIMMAQGYQDLSGQIIKRVITLVNDVEQSLVRLVKLASSVEMAAGLAATPPPTPEDGHGEAAGSGHQSEQERKIRAEGPSLLRDGAPSKEVVSGQDDVDELLSSLGF